MCSVAALLQRACQHLVFLPPGGRALCLPHCPPTPAQRSSALPPSAASPNTHAHTSPCAIVPMSCHESMKVLKFKHRCSSAAPLQPTLAELEKVVALVGACGSNSQPAAGTKGV